ncbi:MAG: nicotinate phosphoribosyltransferase, partial [Methanomethylophilus sp.]|nr:nicotinate phosphoribosyltransferase [Methanomethylophilus sp.]
AFLTRKARAMLDGAGLPGIKIVASNSLDEYIIKDLIEQGACIDSFGVGDRLITSHSNPVFGGVYKLAAVEENGVIVPKIKISNNVSKITTPGYKKVYRLYGKADGRALADLVCLADEEIDPSKPLTIFDPDAPWKKKTLTDFTVRPLQVKVFEGGKQVYRSPELKEIRSYCAEQIGTLWDEVKRFSNPQTYYVDLSEKLWKLKRSMLDNGGVYRPE